MFDEGLYPGFQMAVFAVSSQKEQGTSLKCLFIYIYKFIYLFLAASGLRCCARAFSSCGKQGLLFLVVHGLLTAVASLVAEHGL